MLKIKQDFIRARKRKILIKVRKKFNFLPCKEKKNLVKKYGKFLYDNKHKSTDFNQTDFFLFIAKNKLL